MNCFNGIYDRTNLSGCRKEQAECTADCIGDSHPFPARCLWKVILRAAEPFSIHVTLTVFHCENHLAVFNNTGKQAGQPEPEHASRAAVADGNCRTYDVTGAQRRSKRSRYRLIS